MMQPLYESGSSRPRPPPTSPPPPLRLSSCVKLRVTFVWSGGATFHCKEGKAFPICICLFILRHYTIYPTLIEDFFDAIRLLLPAPADLELAPSTYATFPTSKNGKHSQDGLLHGMAKIIGCDYMASFPIRTSFEKMFLCQISSVSSRRIRLLLKNFTSDFVSHGGNSSKKWSPNIWARQVHRASHSVIIWWGVSSSNKSSHNLQETSPGGGEIPWNTIAFCLLKKACPVRNRATRPTLSLER